MRAQDCWLTILRYNLSVLRTEEGKWYVGRAHTAVKEWRTRGSLLDFVDLIGGEADGPLLMAPGVGLNLPEAVEDWCNRNNVEVP